MTFCNIIVLLLDKYNNNNLFLRKNDEPTILKQKIRETEQLIRTYKYKR
jgi:hypothetical protein